MSYIVEKFEDDSGRYMVKNTEKGWFIPTETEMEAEFICERFIEDTSIEKEPRSIEEYYTEWEQLLSSLSNKERALHSVKETYSELEFELLTTFDFKKEYGKDNDKIRNNHIKKELKEFVDRKNDLELQISHLKRRVEFIKSLMSMQKALIECGVME